MARGPVHRDLPARRIADDPAIALRGGEYRRRNALAEVLARDAAAAHADHRGGDDFLGALHVHRLPTHLRADPRRPAQRDAPNGDARIPTRNSRRCAGRRCGARSGNGPVPPCRDPLQLLRSPAARLATGRERQMSADTQDTRGMDYLVSLPKRAVVVYLPLAVFLITLLFPFYWMAMTSFKPNAELISHEDNPFWIANPTLAHFKKLLFDTEYPQWMWNTMLVAFVSTFISLTASVLAAYAIERLRFKSSRQVGLAIFLAYLVPPSILFIPLATMVYRLGLFDSKFALILTYPTFLIPFCTWLLMGYFRSIPLEIEECALIDGASRWQILTKIVLPLAVPGLISAGIFAFTLSWNEFIYALTFIQSSENKTVPISVVTELVEGDVYHWGSLMAGALLGSLPVAIVYSFFVEYYVAGMTGAVKE